jgi:hypothetical protein
LIDIKHNPTFQKGVEQTKSATQQRADPKKEAGELNQPETQQSLGRTATGGRCRAETTVGMNKRREDIRRFTIRQKIERHADLRLGGGLNRDDRKIGFPPNTGDTRTAFHRARAIA